MSCVRTHRHEYQVAVPRPKAARGTTARAAAWFGTSLIALAAACVAASAQTADTAGASHSLPAVTVEAPKEKPKVAPVHPRPVKTVAKVAPIRTKRRKEPVAPVAQRRPATPVAAAPTIPARPVDPQSPTGPGVGFSATRTTTATKTDTPIIQTPQSISVVTQDQIRDTGAQTVNDAISYSAGVSTAPFGYDPRVDTFTVRGFQTNTVGLYKDGLRQGNGNFAMFENEVYDLDRIEILRGPSSVLYGSGNPGGIVNLVSKTPVEQTFGNIGFDVGSYNRDQTRIDINTPLGTGGNVWFRVDGLFRHSSTQIQGTLDNRADISPSLKFDFDNRTTLTLLGNYAGNRQPTWPYFLRTATDYVFPLRAGDPGFDGLNQNQSSVGYKFEHYFNDNVVVRQNFRTGTVGWDGAFVSQQIPIDFSNPATFPVNPRAAGVIIDHLYTTEVDTNLQLKFHTGPIDHTFLAGIDYFEEQSHETEQVGAQSPLIIPPAGNGYAPSINLLNPVYGVGPYITPQPFFNTAQTLNQLGGYVQEQATWGGLHLSLGGREDTATTVTNNILAGTATQTQNNNAFSGRAGALYLFDNGVAPYVSFATSFLPVPGEGADGMAFKPTTGQQIEGGFKYAPPGWHSTLTASYYNIYQDNVLVPNPNNAMFETQQGQERSAGFELEAIIGLAPGLNGIASYSNDDIVNTQGNTTNALGTVVSDVGKVPVGIPRTLTSFFLDYTIQSGPLAHFGGGGGMRYVGGTYADPLNEQRKNGNITAVDLQAHYDYRNLRFQVSARNIADQRVPICQDPTCAFSEARIVLGSLTAHW